MRKADDRQSAEYLRGAAHAFTFAATVGVRMSPAYAARETERLRKMADAGTPTPSLLPFLAELAAGREADAVMDEWKNRLGRIL